MTDATLPLVGTIGLTTISGDVGKLIKFGQFLNGQGFKDFEHAFLLGPNGKILEAEPGGAKIGNVSEYSTIYWCTNIASQYTEPQLASVWTGAQKYVGTKYSFLDYDALAAHRLHIPAPGLQNFIKDSGHLICSQLCDQAYLDQGYHLFNGVWQGYVTPLGIYNLDEKIKNTRAIYRQGGYRPLARPRTVKM
jgi:hypothetical protein